MSTTAGIGTYVSSKSLSHTSAAARLNSWYQKAKDSAIGSSFDQHVVGGYRFLMRFYNPGDEIYMFGFSRGAYIARFLAEMLDYIGLLSHGNEEMVRFAWKTFSQWQCRQGGGSDPDGGSAAEAARAKQHEMYKFMKGFRETFSRPVGRIRFLGLFDTVNSVPRFETAWMQRSKFPYTAKSSAKYIRHAVSIDERRAKFRQDLMYQEKPKHKHRHHRHHHRLGELKDKVEVEHKHKKMPEQQTQKTTGEPGANGKEVKPGLGAQKDLRPVTPEPDEAANERGRREKQLSPDARQKGGRDMGHLRWDSDTGMYAPYRARSRSAARPRSASGHQRDVSRTGDSDSVSVLSGAPVSSFGGEDEGDDDKAQDIDEVWFSGQHGDVGGGWEAPADHKSSSHIPLAWMVREAMRAGLPFDAIKVAELGCGYGHAGRGGDRAAQNGSAAAQEVPNIHISRTQSSLNMDMDLDNSEAPANTSQGSKSVEDEFHELISRAHTARIHDSLEFGGGLHFLTVAAWKFMEYLPFRRMDLRSDGSWEPIRWPLPRGEVRDIPATARVHGSVIQRMKLDESYRPGNLIIGGGGRGVRKAGPEHGIGEWECVSEPGDILGEVWVKKQRGDSRDGRQEKMSEKEV